MTMISAIGSARCDALADAIRTEFGGILAERILEAEAVDFVWEARLQERYLGQHFDVGMSVEEAERELSRVAVLSALDGGWHAAVCLVDGDGTAVDLLWKQVFDTRQEAEMAFRRAA